MESFRGLETQVLRAKYRGPEFEGPTGLENHGRVPKNKKQKCFIAIKLFGKCSPVPYPVSSPFFVSSLVFRYP
jgi:hypothetical protein